VVPALLVGIAPVTDMEQGVERRLSDDGDAVQRFMKCVPSAETMHLYDEASPIRHIPTRVPSILVTGLRDDVVPADMVRSLLSIGPRHMHSLVAPLPRPFAGGDVLSGRRARHAVGPGSLSSIRLGRQSGLMLMHLCASRHTHRLIIST
jgi:hypothetical protein